MTPSLSAILINLFRTHHLVLSMQVKDITQEESMLQLPFQGNCLNWVVGHILDTYNTCVEWLGQPPLWSEEGAKLYGHGSEPMTDPKKAYDLQDMLQKLDLGIEQITTQLANLTPDEMERSIDYWMGKVTLIEALFYMMWHSHYHTGNLELLRQLAGKNNKIL